MASWKAPEPERKGESRILCECHDVAAARLEKQKQSGGAGLSQFNPLWTCSKGVTRLARK